MNKALFLDRDGTLNKDKKFVYKIEELKILNGVIEGLKYAQSLGYIFIIITNQSGIGRGYYTEDQFKQFTQALIDILEKNGIFIRDLFYCPHKPSENCECRKPSPKFVLEASEKYNIDISKSYFIGDKDFDILCGKNAGCKTIRILGDYDVSIKADYDIKSLDEIKSIIN
jgi:D,D-heptose 1,7-bisphosphate phosphatase